MTIWTWPDTAHCYYTTCDGCICTTCDGCCNKIIDIDRWQCNTCEGCLCTTCDERLSTTICRICKHNSLLWMLNHWKLQFTKILIRDGRTKNARPIVAWPEIAWQDTACPNTAWPDIAIKCRTDIRSSINQWSTEPVSNVLVQNEKSSSILYFFQRKI